MQKMGALLTEWVLFTVASMCFNALHTDITSDSKHESRFTLYPVAVARGCARVHGVGRDIS